MPDIFDAASSTPEVPFTNPDEIKLEDLVGEGKKYKSQEEFVKAFAHSQNHIARVQTENSTYREEIDKRVTVEEAIAKLAKRDETNSEPVHQPISEEPPQQADASITKEEILKLLEEQRQTSAAEQNLELSMSKVIEFAGSEAAAKEFIAEKARELGKSPAELRDEAKKSPAAFFKLTDLNSEPLKGEKRPTSYRPTPQKAAPNPDHPTTLDDYLELKRTNRAKFYTPTVQKEYLQVAMKSRLSGA